MRTEGATPAVIYGAKSTTDEHGSIDDQLARCREHAERNGWPVAAEYRDEKASAYHGNRGDGLADARRHAAELAGEHGSAILLVFATDRLARGDGKQANHLVEYVLDGIKTGYRIESVTENLGGEMALVLASLYGERANADSRAKSAHVSAGLARMAREGRALGPRPRYGFRFEGAREKRQLAHDPAEAPIAGRIVARYLEGLGDGRIAWELNADGVPTRNGGPWDHSMVARVLTSPQIAGLVHVNREIFEGEHEPIIDRSTWDEVRRLRDARRSKAGPGRPPKGRHLLVGGIFRCGRCGGAMRPSTKMRRRDGTPTERYVCATREDRYRGGELCDMPPLMRSAVDEPLLDYLADVIFDLDATREAINAGARRRLDEAVALRASAERQLRETEANLVRIRGDYLRGAIRPDDWNSFREELEAERQAAAAEVDRHAARAEELEAELDAFDPESELLHRLAALRATVAGRIEPGASVEELRVAIALVFDRFSVVRPEGLDPVLVPRVRTDAIERYAAELQIAPGDLRGIAIPRRVSLTAATSGTTPS
jgi:DNA invertase Pin-like site-specific DNA recombinase